MLNNKENKDNGMLYLKNKSFIVLNKILLKHFHFILQKNTNKSIITNNQSLIFNPK
jgi:hypothetical protein